MDLGEIIITKCQAQNADFREADLTKSNLTLMDFLNSHFNHTNLTESDLFFAVNYDINNPAIKNLINSPPPNPPPYKGEGEVDVTYLIAGLIIYLCKLHDFSNDIGIKALLSFGHRQPVAGATRGIDFPRGREFNILKLFSH